MARSVTLFNVVAVIATTWILRVAIRAVLRRLRMTRLRGPPRMGFISGRAKQLFESTDAGSLYEAWANECGLVYEVPTAFGGNKIVLCDPKALAHFYAKETWTYVHIPQASAWLKRNFGRGILWAQGEGHKRQRKSMIPAFNQAAIRNLTSVFYNNTYRVKAAWDSLIDGSGGNSATIDVQTCFCRKDEPYFGQAVKRDAANNGGYFRKLLESAKREKEEGVVDGKEEKSIIAVLLKAKDAGSESPEEVVTQIRVLLVAGYESTSISMTWTLLELAQNPDIQSKLRDELLAFAGEPTYDQLNRGLSYLDSVVHEILRLHPPLAGFLRVAVEYDVILLSEPVRTKSGEVVDHIAIARDTQIGLPIACTNRSTSLWGSDAKVFRPESWLTEGGIPKKAQKVQGHRRLLTFVDGQRTCLGKSFAVTEFKVVLSVLVKSFKFEMRDDPDTRVKMGRALLPRPKLVGEEGTRLPLRVTRYEG
ncbi:hypothetical protein ID866_10074 [Astraeus odoratus]|nr:hypothetical protein ID866_10074 [Astraeus odoratus]